MRGLIIGITGAMAAAGVIIATGQVLAKALGGGQSAYGLLFGAVFVGLGTGIAFGPSIARDLARERIFGVAIVGAGVMVLLLSWTFTLWIALLLVVLMGSSPASRTSPASRCSAPRSRTRYVAGPSRSSSPWCGRR